MQPCVTEQQPFKKSNKKKLYTLNQQRLSELQPSLKIASKSVFSHRKNNQRILEKSQKQSPVEQTKTHNHGLNDLKEFSESFLLENKDLLNSTPQIEIDTNLNNIKQSTIYITEKYLQDLNTNYLKIDSDKSELQDTQPPTLVDSEPISCTLVDSEPISCMDDKVASFLDFFFEKKPMPEVTQPIVKPHVLEANLKEDKKPDFDHSKSSVFDPVLKPIQADKISILNPTEASNHDTFRMKTGSSSCSSLDKDEDDDPALEKDVSEKVNLPKAEESVVESIDDFFNIMDVKNKKVSRFKLKSTVKSMNAFNKCVELRKVIKNLEDCQTHEVERMKKRTEKCVRFLDERKGFYLLPDQQEDLREPVYSVNSSVNNPEWRFDKSKNDYSITKARRESLS